MEDVITINKEVRKMDAKNIFKSKTLWGNVLALALIAAQLFGVVPTVMDPEKQAGIVALGNFILRFFTKQPVSLSTK